MLNFASPSLKARAHTALSTLRGFGRSCRCIPPWRLRAQRCGVRTAQGSISHLFHTYMHVCELWTWEALEQKLEKVGTLLKCGLARTDGSIEERD